MKSEVFGSEGQATRPGYATLIGDVVSSKQHRDRAQLQAAVNTALDSANTWLNPSQLIAPTVGDEFQAIFETVEEAALASLMLRLLLLCCEPSIDSRYGLGVGEVTVFEGDARVPLQDGPGWWAARASITHVHELAQRPRTSTARTWASLWGPDDAASDLGTVNAFLLTRDWMVDRMSPRQRRALLGLLRNQDQPQIARAEGINQGSLSASLARSGANVIVDGHSQLGGPGK